MKLNLGCGKDIRSGFVNIDRIPQGKTPTDVYRQGDIQSLDWITEENTVDEIIAIDCIEYLPKNAIEPTIINWISKLTNNGIIKILVPDCHAIARAFSQGQFDLKEYAQMLFGNQDGNDDRLSVIDASTLLNIIIAAGLTITLKRYDGVAFYVEATR